MTKNTLLDEDEVAEGLVLTCVAHATTDEIALDFDDVWAHPCVRFKKLFKGFSVRGFENPHIWNSDLFTDGILYFQTDFWSLYFLKSEQSFVANGRAFKYFFPRTPKKNFYLKSAYFLP